MLYEWKSTFQYIHYHKSSFLVLYSITFSQDSNSFRRGAKICSVENLTIAFFVTKSPQTLNTWLKQLCQCYWRQVVRCKCLLTSDCAPPHNKSSLHQPNIFLHFFFKILCIMSIECGKKFVVIIILEVACIKNSKVKWKKRVVEEKQEKLKSSRWLLFCS